MEEGALTGVREGDKFHFLLLVFTPIFKEMFICGAFGRKV